MKKEQIYYLHPLLTPKILEYVTDFDMQVEEAKRYVNEEWKRVKRLKQVDRLYLGHFFNQPKPDELDNGVISVKTNPWFKYYIKSGAEYVPFEGDLNFYVSNNKSKPQLETPLCVRLNDIFKVNQNDCSQCGLQIFNHLGFDVKVYTNLDYFINENLILFENAYKLKLAILCLENILYNPNALMNNEILNAQREELVWTIRDGATGLYTQLKREIKSIEVNTDNIQKFTLGVNNQGVKYGTI